MLDNNICSLCITYEKDAYGNLRLFRIADAVDGALIPFVLSDTLDRGFYNINVIYNPKLNSQGDVGLWDWYSEGIWSQQSNAHNDARWMEYVEIDNAHNANEVIARLRSGVENIATDHDYLFGFEQMSSRVVSCLYVSGTDFQVMKDSVSLMDKVYVLNIYQISLDDVYQIQDDYRLPKTKTQYYRYLEPGDIKSKVYVKSINSIIKELITSSIRKYTSYGPTKYRHVVRDFLQLIPDSSLADTLAEKLECDQKTAQSYMEEFLATCELYFSCKDFDSLLMQRLINGDAEIAQIFMRQVSQEWTANHVSEIEKANAELARLNEKVTKAQRTAMEIDQAIQAKEQKTLVLNSEYNKLVDTASAIEKGISERLHKATGDVADFFAQYALFAPRQATTIVDTCIKRISVGKVVSDQPERITDLDDLYDSLQENLNYAGVDRARCESLAAYLLAAYFNRMPLILAGYGADQIAHSLSVTLRNKYAHQIYDARTAGAADLSQVSDGDIVLIHNVFDMIFLKDAMEERPFLYYLISSTTAEELAIEPRGIYNYALPLFAEFFITMPKSECFEGYISNVDYQSKQVEKKAPLLHNELPPYARMMSRRIVGDMNEISNRDSQYELALLQTLPMLLLNKGSDETCDLIAESEFTDNEKKQMLRLIGEYDA